MSAQSKLDEKIALLNSIVSHSLVEIGDNSQEEYKRITRENINKVTTGVWYGSNDDKGQNTGLVVEDTIQVKNISSSGSMGSVTIGFAGLGGHTSWVDGRGVDVIDILEDGGYTVLSGGGRKPPINAQNDTKLFLYKLDGKYPLYSKPFIDLLKAWGFTVG